METFLARKILPYYKEHCTYFLVTTAKGIYVSEIDPLGEELSLVPLDVEGNAVPKGEELAEYVDLGYLMEEDYQSDVYAHMATAEDRHTTEVGRSKKVTRAFVLLGVIISITCLALIWAYYYVVRK